MLRTIDFMQENYYEQMITRKQLAEIAGISPWHYSRKFNERYGKPPLDYLAHYRIYRAQEALVRTTATVQDIAQKQVLRMRIILVVVSNKSQELLEKLSTDVVSTPYHCAFSYLCRGHDPSGYCSVCCCVYSDDAALIKQICSVRTM